MRQPARSVQRRRLDDFTVQAEGTKRYVKLGLMLMRGQGLNGKDMRAHRFSGMAAASSDAAAALTSASCMNAASVCGKTALTRGGGFRWPPMRAGSLPAMHCGGCPSRDGGTAMGQPAPWLVHWVPA